MSGELVYDLFEGPSLWSRAVTVGVTLGAILLAMWVFVPVATGLFSPDPSRPDEAAAREPQIPSAETTTETAQQFVHTISLDVAMATSDAVEASPESTVPSTETDPAFFTATAVTTKSQMRLQNAPATSAVDVNSVLFLRPPLPRSRPSAHGTPIPLPLPRPRTANYRSMALPEATSDRFGIN